MNHTLKWGRLGREGCSWASAANLVSGLAAGSLTPRSRNNSQSVMTMALGQPVTFNHTLPRQEEVRTQDKLPPQT